MRKATAAWSLLCYCCLIYGNGHMTKWVMSNFMYLRLLYWKVIYCSTHFSSFAEVSTWKYGCKLEILDAVRSAMLCRKEKKNLTFYLTPTGKSSLLISHSVLHITTNSTLIMVVTPTDTFQNSLLQYFTQSFHMLLFASNSASDSVVQLSHTRQCHLYFLCFWLHIHVSGLFNKENLLNAFCRWYFSQNTGSY